MPPPATYAFTFSRRESGTVGAPGQNFVVAHGTKMMWYLFISVRFSRNTGESSLMSVKFWVPPISDAVARDLAESELGQHVLHLVGVGVVDRDAGIHIPRVRIPLPGQVRLIGGQRRRPRRDLEVDDAQELPLLHHQLLVRPRDHRQREGPVGRSERAGRVASQLDALRAVGPVGRRLHGTAGDVDQRPGDRQAAGSARETVPVSIASGVMLQPSVSLPPRSEPPTSNLGPLGFPVVGASVVLLVSSLVLLGLVDVEVLSEVPVEVPSRGARQAKSKSRGPGEVACVAVCPAPSSEQPADSAETSESARQEVAERMRSRSSHRCTRPTVQPCCCVASTATQASCREVSP